MPSIGNVLTQLQLKKFQCQPHSPVASHCRHSIFNRHSKFAATEMKCLQCVSICGVSISRAGQQGRAGRQAGEPRQLESTLTDRRIPRLSLCLSLSISFSLCAWPHQYQCPPSAAESVCGSLCLPLWPLLAQRRHCCLLVKVLCQRLSHNIN